MLEIATLRVILAQGKLNEAIPRLTCSLNTAETSGRLGAVLEMRILRCLAHKQQGDLSAAAADLEQALTLAKPEGYVRIFLDEGQPMKQLLTQWLAQAGVGSLREYAVQLLSQFDSEPQFISTSQEKIAPTDNLIEPLSQREMEVLCLLAQGRTNQEIARQLFVAPGTVKAHTASIYRKLEAANRTEAVARARLFGLLS
jgi:LuxR family maltose regulon positive regulatory protein